MENKPIENFDDVIAQLKERAAKLEPGRAGFDYFYDRLAVTGDDELRFNKQKVNIISPFYSFMSNTGKVLSVLAIVAVCAIGGIAYYQLAVPVGTEIGDVARDLAAKPAEDEVNIEVSAVSSGEPVAGLLDSLQQEIVAEDALLARESASAYGAEEDKLLADLNSYDNEI